MTTRGSGFTKVTSVRFGGVKGSALKVASSTHLAVTAPKRPAAAVVPVVVYGVYGTSPVVRTSRYTYLASVQSVQIDGLTTSGVTLNWVNPSDAAFRGVQVRRVSGAVAARSVRAGTKVVDTTGAVDQWSDTGLAPGATYSYALFANNGVLGYAAPVDVTITIPTSPNIVGTVTDSAATPTAVAGVTVTAVNTSSNRELARSTTASDGSYAIAGLRPGNYAVCFNPAGGDSGVGGFGYLPQCWNHTSGGAAPTTVTVAAGGVTVTGVDAALAVAGSMSGKVDDGMATPRPLQGVTVEIDDASGEPTAYATTGSTGTWSASGLNPGSYGVCFDPSMVPGPLRYNGQCYQAVQPAGTPTTVSVSTGTNTAQIDASLTTAQPGATTRAAPRVRRSRVTRAHVAVPTNAVYSGSEVSSATLGAQPCFDVLFLAARGSGESGPGGVKDIPGDPNRGVGGPVWTAYSTFVSDVTDGRTVSPPISVSYPADNVLPNVADLSYVHDLWQGVAEAQRALEARAQQCPNERIVLAGYSQGAMIMHRILTTATTKGVAAVDPSVLARVDAAVLIGDGDRVANDTTNEFGTVKAGAQGVGTQLDATVNVPRLPSSVGTKVFDVCNGGDVVCDFRVPFLCAACAVFNDLAGIYVHLHDYDGTQVTKNAASAAAAREQSVPALGGGTIHVAATAGQLLHQRLSMTLRPSEYRSARWTLAPGSVMPFGTWVGSDGVAEGRPLGAGTRSLTVDLNLVDTLGVPEPPVAVRVTVAVQGTNGGALWAWGYNNTGQLADGTTSDRLRPVPTNLTAGVTKVEAISMGASGGSFVGGTSVNDPGAVVALRSDGTVWQGGLTLPLGTGSTTGCLCSRRLTRVAGLSEVVDIAGSGDTAYALTGDGIVYGWGSQAGLVRVAGMPAIAVIAAGQWGDAYAIDRSGRLWDWGANSSGELGRGKKQNLGPGVVHLRAPAEVVTAGVLMAHVSLADGSVWTMGNDWTSGHEDFNPTVVRGLTDPVQLSDSGGVSYALLANGDVVSWGCSEGSGEGNGSTYLESSVTALPALHNITYIAAGAFDGYAVDSSGQVWSWGQGDDGALGDGTTGTKLGNGVRGRTTPAKIKSTWPGSAVALGRGGIFVGYAIEQ